MDTSRASGPGPSRNRAASTMSRAERSPALSASTMLSTPPPRSPVLGATYPPAYNLFQHSPARLPEDNTGVDPGPGPLRHPRPLTAADLHMQLEKEQEAAVNRLTRELALLRQQTASVVSNTSSTSAGVVPEAGGRSARAPSTSSSQRRHRSSSSLSNRSVQTAMTTAPSVSSSAAGTTNGVAGSTISGIAPPRESFIPSSHSTSRDPLSRQSSVASRRSETSSPSIMSGDPHAGYGSGRHSFSAAAPLGAPAGHRLSSGAISVRHDDAGQTRAELDMVKRENEALKQRIRELERQVRDSGKPE